MLVKCYGILVYMDIVCYVENVYFIKIWEVVYVDWSIRDIVKVMFKEVEVVWMSLKKDGLVNIGGFIVLNDLELYEKFG